MNDKRYEIFDLGTGNGGCYSAFTPRQYVEAASPKEAAEKHAGQPVARHLSPRGGHILVKTTTWPYKTYIYDRITPQ
jgi:hypothetical protein